MMKLTCMKFFLLTISVSITAWSYTQEIFKDSIQGLRKLLPSRTATFIFTDEYESGFHSTNKPSKKWIFKPSNNQILFITNDGREEYYEIIDYNSEKFTFTNRFDLEN